MIVSINSSYWHFSEHVSSLLQKMHNWLHEKDPCWEEKVSAQIGVIGRLWFLIGNRYIKNKNVIFFEIPDYPEFAAKNVWPLIKENPDLLDYFPDFKDTQLPEKEFLYGILCSLNPDVVRELVATGVKNRSPLKQEDKSELIEVTKNLKDSILSLYSMKSKYCLKPTLGASQLPKEDPTICSRNFQSWMWTENPQGNMKLTLQSLLTIDLQMKDMARMRQMRRIRIIAIWIKQRLSMN